MKMLCKDLKEHAKRVIYCEKKEIISLTDEENESHENQKFCYIFKKRFTNNKKVRDPCHFSKIMIIEMYSTYNEGKSIITERFIRTLKNKIDKYMTSISKNVYIDKLADIVNKYNNTYHSTIKMKPVDVESNKYIDSSKKIYNKDCKYKIGDIVSMSKYKNIFAKGCFKLV